jgi:hypothetical protein
MAQGWKRVAYFVVTLGASFAGAANADTITVTFTVTGDHDVTVSSPTVDPVYGNDIATGSFAFSSDLIPVGGGEVEKLSQGLWLGAESVAFSWAGADWTAANADIALLTFDAAGGLTTWVLGGFPSGFDVNFNVSPDFLLSNVTFDYSTPDSFPDRGIFFGRMLEWSASQAAPPVPEPTTLLLFGSGLALAGVRRWCSRKE